MTDTDLDALLQQATWTKTPPTVPGWYWWRRPDKAKPLIREVGHWPGGGLVARECHDFPDAFGNSRIMEIGKLGGEWLGPLSADAVERLVERINYLEANGADAAKAVGKLTVSEAKLEGECERLVERVRQLEAENASLKAADAGWRSYEAARRTSVEAAT